MNPEIFAKLLPFYDSVMARTGVYFKCLQDGCPDDSLSTEASGDSVTIRINGPMDGYFGCSSRNIIEFLDEHDPKEIMLLIESPGGFVSEGLALYSDLMARAKAGVKVSAESRGVVASAAVLPYLAANTRTMGDGAMLMIHNPWVFLMIVGDYDDVAKSSSSAMNGLKANTETYARILSDRTTLKQDEAKAAMSKETWYVSDDAKKAGFAGSITETPMSETHVSKVAQATIQSAGSILAKYRA